MTTISPWLIVPDIRRAADFYRRAFGAGLLEPSSDVDPPPVLHLSVGGPGGADFWIQAGEGAGEGDTQGREPVMRLILTVAEPDACFARAVEAGAEEVFGMHDEFGWRTGRLRDPFGHEWETAWRLDA